jgi:hypothetical protein
VVIGEHIVGRNLNPQTPIAVYLPGSDDDASGLQRRSAEEGSHHL